MGDCSEKTYLSASFEPAESDVICARGKDAFFHAGNKQFREVIESYLPMYIKADTKLEKSTMVMQIVGQIRSDAENGFVRFCPQRKLWYEIGEEAAREKVGQTIRETLTQRDPKKRANKRMKRAINKAKRDAAREAMLEGIPDIEPLPVDNMLSLRYFSQYVSNQPQPTPLSLPNTFPSLANQFSQLHNIAALQPRHLADERVLPIAPPPLDATTSLDLANLMAASSGFSLNSLSPKQESDLQVPYGARGLGDNNMVPPPPALRSLSTKDFELLTSQPSLSLMTSQEWAMQEGVSREEFETMERLYEQHERNQRAQTSLQHAAAC